MVKHDSKACIVRDPPGFTYYIALQNKYVLYGRNFEPQNSLIGKTFEAHSL